MMVVLKDPCVILGRFPPLNSTTRTGEGIVAVLLTTEIIIMMLLLLLSLSLLFSSEA